MEFTSGDQGPSHGCSLANRLGVVRPHATRADVA